MDHLPARLLQNWGIPEHVSVRVPQSGTMNETWLLEWPADRAVLRRHRRPVRAEIEFEHRVLAHARSSGVPCPAIVPTRRGCSLVEDDAHFYSLYTWAPGTQVVRGRLDPEQAESMGAMLGRTHIALADLPGGPAGGDHLSSLEQTLGRIDELINVALARPDRARLSWAIDDLKARARWLTAHNPSPPRQATASSQVIHGDYHDGNVFFEAGKVSCVIDWDKARREVPARELVRAMDYALGMDPQLCRQFLMGYRAVTPISPGQVEEAGEWFSYHEAHSLWVIDQLLRHNNDRVEGLGSHKPFSPFGGRWMEAALYVSP